MTFVGSDLLGRLVRILGTLDRCDHHRPMHTAATHTWRNGHHGSYICIVTARSLRWFCFHFSPIRFGLGTVTLAGTFDSAQFCCLEGYGWASLHLLL